MNTVATDQLEKNLRLIERASPEAARAIRGSFARADLLWTDTPEGPSATITEWDALGMPVSRALASKRSPTTEAQRLTSDIDLAAHPALVVMGFGLGYHVAALARRLKRTGLIIVLEPDASLLRAVLERIDCSFLGESNVLFVTDPEDSSSLVASMSGYQEVLALGVKIVDHPPSKSRLGPHASVFMERFMAIVRATRTSVVTTMVQTEATLRNATQNLDHYATGPGIADLAGKFAGKPAIVVSAGPGLARVVDQLADPRVREKFVIIAVQTVLKTLLARGIRPHFVTALDYHEISRRFYEGLTPSDVQGITLVVETKVNPAVTSAFPGVIRCTQDHFLDKVLGPEQTRNMGEVPLGATVAHLAYYLARFMKCDPVVLVGQDLGFSDGQYYASGAAIHDVWSGELNEFNTLEMMEWQRIARMRHQLTKRTDTLGRPIYTDEQMSAYLMQFEKAFRADSAKGLTTIDASAGGVLKAGTTVGEFAQVLERYASAGWSIAPDAPPQANAQERRNILRATSERVRAVRQDIWRVGKLSRKAESLLTEMLEHQLDQARVDTLITKLDAVRDEAMGIQPAMSMVARLDQAGAFRRIKADRAIYVESELTPMEVQKAQIERDLANVSSLARSAEALGEMFESCLVALSGKPKQTRDPLESRVAKAHQSSGDSTEKTSATKRVAAVIALNFEHTGLGTPATPEAPVLMGKPALSLTLARLAQVKGLSSVCVVSADSARAQRLAGEVPKNLDVQFVDHAVRALAPTSARGARLWSRHSWRGGLCSFTIHDEALDAGALLAGLERTDADAALLVHADWCLVDPALCSQIIDRYREDPISHRLTFSQAAPGLGPCLFDRAVLAQLASGRAGAGPFASVGGLLGYVPTSPAADLIVRSNCVGVPVPMRDALIRCIPDSPARSRLIDRALAKAGLDATRASAEQIALAVNDFARTLAPNPSALTVTLCDRPRTLSVDQVLSACQTIVRSGDESLLTLTGSPAAHPGLASIVTQARALGVSAIQVRSDLSESPDSARIIASVEPEVISFDLIANDPETYAQIMGPQASGRFALSRENLKQLLTLPRRHSETGIPSPWLVARLTRRDEIYQQLEILYDHWLMTTGACVIDPLDAPIPGARIAPLALPRLAQWRRAHERIELRP